MHQSEGVAHWSGHDPTGRPASPEQGVAVFNTRVRFPHSLSNDPGRRGGAVTERQRAQRRTHVMSAEFEAKRTMPLQIRQRLSLRPLGRAPKTRPGTGEDWLFGRDNERPAAIRCEACGEGTQAVRAGARLLLLRPLFPPRWRSDRCAVNSNQRCLTVTHALAAKRLIWSKGSQLMIALSAVNCP